MATMQQQQVKSDTGDATAKQAASTNTIEDRRAVRMAALRKTAGMWANRKDIPADGLEYERAMRAEWR